jgi:hypothetical protein
MAAVSLTKFHCLTADLAHGKHQWDTAVIKILLTNGAPSLSNTIRTNITEISAGNGYTTQGLTLTTTSSGQVSGAYKLVLADFTLTATGNIGPWRYAVLYNSTSASTPLIGWYDYGSSITLSSGEGFLFDFDGTNGVLSLQLVA